MTLTPEGARAWMVVLRELQESGLLGVTFALCGLACFACLCLALIRYMTIRARTSREAIQALVKISVETAALHSHAWEQSRGLQNSRRPPDNGSSGPS